MEERDTDETALGETLAQVIEELAETFDLLADDYRGSALWPWPTTPQPLLLRRHGHAGGRFTVGMRWTYAGTTLGVGRGEVVVARAGQSRLDADGGNSRQGRRKHRIGRPRWPWNTVFPPWRCPHRFGRASSRAILLWSTAPTVALSPGPMRIHW